MTDPDDLVSLLDAHLDDELTADERRRVALALEGSPTLRRELADRAAVRAMVRALPEVANPAVAERPRAVAAPDRLRATAAGSVGGSPAGRPAASRTARPRRFVLAGLVGAAAATVSLFAIGSALGRPPMVPDVDAFAERHVGGGTGGFVVLDGGSMEDPAVLDDLGHGMERDGVFGRGGVVWTVYTDGAHAVSVFHEAGEVDWGAMPATGSVVDVPAGRGWQAPMDDAMVLVVERGDLVVTVVGDADMGVETVLEVSAMVPPVERDEPLWRRLMAAPTNVLDRI